MDGSETLRRLLLEMKEQIDTLAERVRVLEAWQESVKLVELREDWEASDRQDY